MLYLCIVLKIILIQELAQEAKKKQLWFRILGDFEEEEWATNSAFKDLE
jgi:hypothetical protein